MDKLALQTGSLCTVSAPQQFLTHIKSALQQLLMHIKLALQQLRMNIKSHCKRLLMHIKSALANNRLLKLISLVVYDVTYAH